MEIEPSDEQLVHRTLAGEVTAFEELVRRYRRPAFACALAVVGDREEADDVAQETMIQAYTQLATLRSPGKFGAWLLVAVRRRAMNAVRTRRRQRRAPLDPGLPAVDNVPGEFSDMRATLLRALDTLTPVQREVVLLADLSEWSHEVIAKTLGISVFMSRRHLSGARKRLRAILSTRPDAL